MKNKFIGSILLGVLLVVSTQCKGPRTSSKNIIETEEERPQWVTMRPTDGAYYIGVAVASKTANPTSYSTVAQRNALNELAASIKVRVKSNSMLFSFEDENEFRDEYKEFVQVKTNQKIAHYELVDAWENEREYWVYYRLSKAQFKKDKKVKIDKATNLSINLLHQGQVEWERGNYRAGMKYYFAALNPLKPYAGESLEVTIDGQNGVFLGNHIIDHISKGIRSFNIRAKKSQITVSWGAKIPSKDLTFNITDQSGNPLAEIPVKFTYSEGIIRPRTGISGQGGQVITEIKKLVSTKNNQQIQVEIDFKTMIEGSARPDEINQLIFSKILAPKSMIKLQVQAPSLYVTSSEKSFGKGHGSIIESAFRKKASEMGFVLTSNKRTATLIVSIQVDTREAGVSYDLSNSLLNASITITDRQRDMVVYQDKLSNIKGVSGSYDQASKEAYLKAEQEIIKKIVPRFYRKYTS